jgi:hypothetical protein
MVMQLKRPTQMQELAKEDLIKSKIPSKAFLQKCAKTRNTYLKIKPLGVSKARDHLLPKVLVGGGTFPRIVRKYHHRGT